MPVYFDIIFGNIDEKFSVLVVDDSSTVRAIYGTNLRKLRNTVIHNCENAEKALETCQKFEFDLVLIDYEMPGMNGIELLRELRQLENFRTVPMIMVTASTDQKVKLASLDAGINDFLRKPFDPIELRARVANMLVLRHAQKRLSIEIQS